MHMFSSFDYLFDAFIFCLKSDAPPFFVVKIVARSVSIVSEAPGAARQASKYIAPYNLNHLESKLMSLCLGKLLHVGDPMSGYMCRTYIDTLPSP